MVYYYPWIPYSQLQLPGLITYCLQKKKLSTLMHCCTELKRHLNKSVDKQSRVLNSLFNL